MKCYSQKMFIYYTFVGIPEYMYINRMYTSVCDSKKEVSDPLELELQAIVKYLTWVLGVEPDSSTRTNN